MVTETKSDPESISAYSEEDKLGPLGSRASALHDGAELRAKVIGEFNSAVHAARAAAATTEQGTASAVHESRKALRRARAVLSMVRGTLPKSERHAVKAALQEARRALSTIRDHSVAPETLGQLPLSDDDRDTARRILDSAAEAIPPTPEIKQLLGEAAARAAAQAEALQAALPQTLSWADLADGIKRVYAEARRARRRGRLSKRWFHTWRRRSKELACALDFVARQAGPRAAAIHGEIEGINALLGPAVDLIMVRDFVATHGAGQSSDDVKHLRSSIDAALDDLIKDGRKAGKDAFDVKPKKFEKRLTKAVRRDLTPLDEERVDGQLPGG
jgi:CHAD domain-containing protein